MRFIILIFEAISTVIPKLSHSSHKNSKSYYSFFQMRYIGWRDYQAPIRIIMKVLSIENFFSESFKMIL